MKRILLIIIVGFVLGCAAVISVNKVFYVTSTNESCSACHMHPHAEATWKKSVHHNSKSGVVTNCVDCHLPPKGDFAHFKAKVSTGVKDLVSYMMNDSVDINWEAKRTLENASKFVYNESCINCHINIFPSGLTDEGITAHLYYEENKEKLDLQCISCHMDAGHYDPTKVHARMTGLPQVQTEDKEIFHEAASISEFATFTETVPGTTASFKMVAIPEGGFTMGSSPDEPYHKSDEAPQRDITLSKFFIGETEVTWDMYWSFYAETFSEGRTPPDTIYARNTRPDIDVVSGPTPPFGIPDQGWGSGSRPAITMTHYAAETFCQWLSLKTGKKYRLPTEAEWEYAVRGGTQTPYFFEGNPKKFSDDSFWRKFVDADTAVINSYIVYSKNSDLKTKEPSGVSANPYGLKNMLGNVMEYCSDWYSETAYADGTSLNNPKGPSSGTERVVRGGDFRDDAANLRSASRGKTDHDNWLKTDPQQPKSIWWYSDIKSIGFRVVCEWEE